MQVVKELPEGAMALPVDMDQYEERREYLEELAERGVSDSGAAPVQSIVLMNPDQAAELARRRAYHLGLAQDVARPYDAEIARNAEKIAALQLENGRLAMERDAAMKPFLQKASWYDAPLEAFMRALTQVDQKLKHWQTPWGTLKLTKQQPEWRYPDDHSAIITGFRQFVRVKEELDKNALKKAAEVKPDGTVFLKETGEEIPGVLVVERAPKFEIELSKGA